MGWPLGCRDQRLEVNHVFPWHLVTYTANDIFGPTHSAMSNYGPQEDAYALYTEKTFMLSSFIYTIGYGACVRSGSIRAALIRPPGTGVQLVLYFNCASLFLQQRHRQPKYTLVRLAYITVLLILASLIAATAIWVLVDMYIENRNYPGGPMAYFLDTNQPLGTTVFGSLFASNFMGDLLVVSTFTPFSLPCS